MTEPFHIDIKENINEIRSNLTLVERQQFPFALGRALTNTAYKALGALQEHMDRVFDRPTSYTKRAFYVKPAKRGDRSVFISAREWAGKGNPAYKYLMPENFGGSRGMKRYERALAHISGGQYVMPARGAKLDKFGNVSRGQIVKVLSRLHAAERTAGYTANMSAKTMASLRKRKKTVKVNGHTSEFFVAKDKRSEQPIGIYQLVRKGRVEPVFNFTRKKPVYSKRMQFEPVIVKSFNENFEPEMRSALDYAVRTAR